MKYYFNDKDDYEICYTLEYWKDYIKENDIKEITLIEAKTVNDPDMFFCRNYGEVEKKETCSKETCESYEPRNRKSGICRHYRQLKQITDKAIKLTKPPKL